MPVNISLLPDEVIARGITGADWSKAPGAFWAGQDQAQKQAERNLFSGGLPRTPAGDVDYSQIAEQLARVQGAGAIGSLAGLRTGDIQQQVLRGIGQGGGGVFSPPPLPQQEPREPPPPSTGRPPAQSQSYLLEPERRLRPDQEGNTSADGQVIDVTVDGQSTGPMASSFAPPTQPTPTVRQFSQSPVTGPPIDRFAPPPQQVAQAQPRPQYGNVPPAAEQSPIPPGSPGFYSLENAASNEQQAGRASAISAALGAAGLPAAAAGYKQQSDHLYDTAKQIREHLGKVGEEREKARLKVEGELPTKLAEHSVTQIAKTYEKAQTFAEGVPATQNLLDQINSKSGIFSGKWATQRLAWAKIGEVVGVPDDRVMPTEAYQSLVGRKVAATVKSFGSGTSITNQDREYASNMEGGNINLDESSMRRILTLSDQVARDQIKNHNRDVDKLQKVYPAAPLGNFKVEEPPKLAGRTTEPKPGPPGAIPPAPSMEQRQPNQVYQTPKGPARWRGTGWELVR